MSKGRNPFEFDPTATADIGETVENIPIIPEPEKDPKKLSRLVESDQKEESNPDIFAHPSIQLAYTRIIDELLLAGKQPDFKKIKGFLRRALTDRDGFAQALIETGEDPTKVGLEKETTKYTHSISWLLGEISSRNFFIVGEKSDFLTVDVSPDATITESPNNKYYTTIPLDKFNFIENLPELGEQLNELSKKTGDKIKFKIPKTFDVFVSHRDSFIVYFKNPENQNEVKKIVGAWAQKYMLGSNKRQLGRSEFAQDTSGSSFSNEAAIEAAYYINEHVRQNHDTSTVVKNALKKAVEIARKSNIGS